MKINTASQKVPTENGEWKMSKELWPRDDSMERQSFWNQVLSFCSGMGLLCLPFHGNTLLYFQFCAQPPGPTLVPRDTRTWLSFSSTYWKEKKAIRRPSWVKSFIMIPVTIVKWFFYPFICMSPFSYCVDAFSKMKTAKTAKFNTIIQFFTLKHYLYVCPGKLIRCWSPIFFKFQKEILWLLPWPL